MKFTLTSLAGTLLIASVCNAQSIVGCADGFRITFQATPCPEGALATPTSIPASIQSSPVKSAASFDDETTSTTQTRKSLRYRYAVHTSRDQLQAGMTDLQVLNNRRWGKPQNITRNRENNAWHEYWDYKTGANGGKQLHFVNGVLADIDELEQVSKPMRMASATMAEGL